MSSVSGLSYRDRIRARDMAVQAAYLGMRNGAALHYTEGPERWEGIDRHLKAWRGGFPSYADCSSFATWCLWNGLDHFHVRDVVNGAGWGSGYTGTMLEHGKRVEHEGNVLRGDCVIYGDGWPGLHTAICVGSGLVISNGSEAGPFLLPIHYRDDVLEIRRYI